MALHIWALFALASFIEATPMVAKNFGSNNNSEARTRDNFLSQRESIERTLSATCDEESWPDKDHGLVCGECMVLVDRFDSFYKTCKGYCASVGRQCVGAWEEKDDDCNVAYPLTCDQTISSSDAICECGAEVDCYGELSALASDEGSGIGTVSTRSAEECKRSCSGSTQCQSVSFCPQWNSCFLKDRSFNGGEPTRELEECKTYYKTPCTDGATGMPTTTLPSHTLPPCLCVFDIDRTLTGKQGDTSMCPRNRVLSGIHDRGYGGGVATLSALSSEGLSQTFCRSCYLGICSAGTGSGATSDWNWYILNEIMRSDPQDALTAADPSIKRWSYGSDVRSPYVLSQGNRIKQFAVEGIREWYERRGVNIPSDEVYFFGDRTENIQPFSSLRLNSREISCGSRDKHLYGGSGMVGYCGATPEEVKKVKGNFNCKHF